MTPTYEDTMTTARTAHRTANEEQSDQRAATEKDQVASTTTEQLAELQTLHSSQLPDLRTKYDPMDAWNARIFSRLVSDRGNAGLAFSMVPANTSEEKVFATIFVNNKTRIAPRPLLQQVIDGPTAAPAPAPQEHSVQLRGKILWGFGAVGEFDGIKPGVSEEERAQVVQSLITTNPKLGNLVGKYGATLDVHAGDNMNFLNSVMIKAKHLPDVIRDLSNANGNTGKQSVGCFRLAMVLEAAMRQFERDGLIPASGVAGPIAVDRFKQERAASAAASATQARTGAAPRATSTVDDEPPF